MKKVCVVILSVLSLIFISCATTIPVTVTRPSKIDVGSAKTISVLPFNVSDDLPFWFAVLTDNFDQGQVNTADYLTSGLNNKLASSKYFTLLDVPHEKYESDSTIKSDIYITGKIISFYSNIEHYTEKIEETDKKENKKSDDPEFLEEKPKKKVRFVEHYKRNVSASVEYKVVETKTKRILLSNVKDFSSSSADYESSSSVPSSLSLIKSYLDNIQNEILTNIQPYNVTLSLKLLDDKTKNADLADAKALAKNGNISQSKEKYYYVYESTGDFTAGYNAALLMEAQGDLENAKSLLEDLVIATSDDRAIKALNNVQYEINEKQKLQNQQNAKKGNGSTEK
ncbi:MAG: hypothetical protein WCQ67_07130 [Treponema sp.]